MNNTNQTSDSQMINAENKEKTLEEKMKEREEQSNIKNDVFLSYRRADGGSLAIMLHNILKARGADVFMDVHGLGAGRWDNALRTAIDNARYFVFIASPNYFYSEVVRNELSHAIKSKKIIIPIFINNDGYPEFLHKIAAAHANARSSEEIESIAIAALKLGHGEEAYANLNISTNPVKQLIECSIDLHKENGYTLNHSNFDTEINKLCNMLISKAQLVFVEYIKTHADDNDDKDRIIDILVDRWQEEKNDDVVLDQLTSILNRVILYLDEEKTGDFFTKLLKNSYLKDIKKLANNLKIDHRGSHGRIKQKIIDFVRSKKLTFQQQVFSVDKSEVLIDKLSICLRNSDYRGLLLEYAEKYEISIAIGNSSVKGRLSDIFDHEATTLSIEAFLNKLSKELSIQEWELQELWKLIFNGEATTLRKQAIIKELSDWVDSYETADVVANAK